MKPFLYAIILSLTCAAAQAHAINKKSPARSNAYQRRAGDSRADSITGRVVNESGQPIANARVSVSDFRRSRIVSRPATTEEDGSYRVTTLPPGVYSVSAYAPGYTFAEDVYSSARLGPRYHRRGDTVNFTLVKGGVINGTVTGAGGEPVIGVTVWARRVRELDGKPARFLGDSRPRQTDDRGVFRLYGLRQGIYIVFAGGRNIYGTMTPFANEVQTFYPSDTRDTAAEVMLAGGEEVTGINIRYRGEPGHSVSGTVYGPQSQGPVNRGLGVTLGRFTGGQAEGMASMSVDPSNGSFIFRGLPDGEYSLIARRPAYGEDAGATSARVRIKVKGADVTGVELRAVPYGSVTGRVTLEPLPPALGKKAECEARPRGQVEESVVKLRPEQKDPTLEMYYLVLLRTVPDEKGEFAINNVEAGRYAVSTDLLHEDLYIRAITLSKETQPKSTADAGRDGFAVKPGERVSGLTIAVAEGAARLRGKVSPATEGARLPDRLRVHLVPAEKESADDVLRYYEAEVEGGDAFTMTNLAPGKYWVLAKPVDDDGSIDLAPAARDRADRAALRSEAAAANTALELQACRPVADYVLRYTPQVTKPASKK